MPPYQYQGSAECVLKRGVLNGPFLQSRAVGPLSVPSPIALRAQPDNAAELVEGAHLPSGRSQSRPHHLVPNGEDSFDFLAQPGLDGEDQIACYHPYTTPPKPIISRLFLHLYGSLRTNSAIGRQGRRRYKQRYSAYRAANRHASTDVTLPVVPQLIRTPACALGLPIAAQVRQQIGLVVPGRRVLRVAEVRLVIACQ